MQAILKSRHQRFCDWLQDTRNKQDIRDRQLDELEKELQQFYDTYQQKREELRRIILAYEERQKAIRIRVKQNRALPSQNNNGDLPVPDLQLPGTNGKFIQ